MITAAALGGHVPALAGVVIGVVLASVTAGVISIYAHRHVAHGAIEYLHPVLRIVMRTWIWAATGTNCRRWAALHIKHHRTTDRPGDPHSPQVASSALRLGPAANWRAYRRAVDDPTILEAHPPPHAAEPDRWDRLLYDRSALGVALACWCAWGLFGWGTGTVVFLAHAVTYVTYTASVNSLGHAWGYQRYVNPGARYTGNSMLLAALTGGENLHNNHHGDPTSPFLARTRWELLADWPSVALRGLRAVGWARLRTPRQIVPPITHPQFPVTARLLARRSGAVTPTAARRRADLRAREHDVLKGTASRHEGGPAEVRDLIDLSVARRQEQPT